MERDAKQRTFFSCANTNLMEYIQTRGGIGLNIYNEVWGMDVCVFISFPGAIMQEDKSVVLRTNKLKSRM